MRNYVAGVLTAGILLGALRWADLALWTDLDTGLVTAGPVWARYLALALVAGLALLAGELPGASAAAVERPRTRGAKASWNSSRQGASSSVFTRG